MNKTYTLQARIVVGWQHLRKITADAQKTQQADLANALLGSISYHHPLHWHLSSNQQHLSKPSYKVQYPIFK